MKYFRFIFVLILSISLLSSVFSLEGRKGGGGGKGGGKNRQDIVLPTDVANNVAFSIILSSPTQKSIVLNLLSTNTLDGYVEYGIAKGVYEQKSNTVNIPANIPVELMLNNLKPNTRYYYRMQTKIPGATVYTAGQENSFYTQRAPGSTFIFDIQGDSHPERQQQFDAALYTQTLKSAANDRPDFYMTIGDDFSVDTLRVIDADTVKKVYLIQRYFLSLIGKSAPLFLVNGNHEQASMCNIDGTANNVAVLAQNSRNSLFSQPVPNSFYTGDTQKVDNIGLLRDYYAWTWGDALFVTIDPYWHSVMAVDNPLGGGQKSRDMWNATLGDTQYQWLKQTLETNKAKYKFVFAHHVLGTGRGGIEEATLCEWGGYDKNGKYLFDTKRPDWTMPIHQLMVKNGVTIFFQGHDHVFVKEILDGVIYQSLPEPADPNYTLYNADAYMTGDKFSNSGYTRVIVGPDKVTVNYVKQYMPKDENETQKSGDVIYSYTIPAKKL